MFSMKRAGSPALPPNKLLIIALFLITSCHKSSRLNGEGYMVMERTLVNSSKCTYVFKIYYTDNKRLKRPTEMHLVERCGLYSNGDTLR